MKRSQITVEQTLYLLVFGLAICVRFLRLGAPPLSDFEAGWALQAFQVSNREILAVGAQPGYVMLTGLMFFIFGSSNFLARFWPALAGSALVWLPFIFRNKLGQKAALVMAFGLALDPGLVALSRLAGGPMIAVGCGFLAFGMVADTDHPSARRPIIAGILAGLGLLGGSAALQGLLGLALAWGAWRLLSRYNKPDPLNNAQQGEEAQNLINGVKSDQVVDPRIFTPSLFHNWRAIFLTGGLTMLLVGSLFLFIPQGLSGLAGFIPTYLNGWSLSSGIPIMRVLAALVFYQPMALLLGLVAVVRAWIGRNTFSRWLSLWVVTALATVLLYPGRQIADLAWVLIPLWGLAAVELASHLEVNERDRLPAFGQAALSVILITLAWINLAALTRAGNDIQILQLRWAVISGTLALGVVTAMLVALGWSRTAAQRGLAWGISLALGLYGLSCMWGVSQIRSIGVSELWYPAPATQATDLLFNTLGDLAEWRSGQADSLDIAVLINNPSLKWALRAWHTARWINELGVGELPEVIITPGDQTDPKLASSYRGQDFAWSVYPGWDGALPANWVGWVVFREAPVRQDQLILWVRSDLFPGGQLNSVEQPTP